MRRLFAFVLAIALWVGFVSAAPAQAAYDNLTPCSQSAAFAQRMKTSASPTAARRYEQYSKAGLLCGDDGLPHLIVDNPAHMGDFIIPGILFLYIAGWIGWAGRSYLIAIKKGDNPEGKEVVIDVPLAIKFMLGGFAWPAAAFAEMSTGKMFAKENEITVSPR
jgi:photosystem I subunit III